MPLGLRRMRGVKRFVRRSADDRADRIGCVRRRGKFCEAGKDQGQTEYPGGCVPAQLNSGMIPVIIDILNLAAAALSVYAERTG